MATYLNFPSKMRHAFPKLPICYIFPQDLGNRDFVLVSDHPLESFERAREKEGLWYYSLSTNYIFHPLHKRLY